MASCPVQGCTWHGKKAGVPIHLALVHGAHRQGESENTLMESGIDNIATEDPIDTLVRELEERWADNGQPLSTRGANSKVGLESR